MDKLDESISTVEKSVKENLELVQRSQGDRELHTGDY